MVGGRVVHDEVGDDAHTALMGLIDEALEIVHEPVVGMDREEVGDVVAPVAQWRLVHRQEPDAVDAEPLQVVELLDQPAEVAGAVVVAVEEAADVDLVEDRGLEPERIPLEPVPGLRHGCPPGHCPGTRSRDGCAESVKEVVARACRVHGPNTVVACPEASDRRSPGASFTSSRAGTCSGRCSVTTAITSPGCGCLRVPSSGSPGTVTRTARCRTISTCSSRRRSPPGAQACATSAALTRSGSTSGTRVPATSFKAGMERT